MSSRNRRRSASLALRAISALISASDGKLAADSLKGAQLLVGQLGQVMDLQHRLLNDARTGGAGDEIAHDKFDFVSTDARTPSGLRFLTKAQCLALLGISATSLWELQVKADFPRARVLHSDPTGTAGRSLFFAHEVEAWMLSRPTRVLRSDRSAGGAQ